jgi:hypothetical protein
MKIDLKDPRHYPPDAAQPGEAMALIRQEREAIAARTERLRRERLNFAHKDVAHADRKSGTREKAR